MNCNKCFESIIKDDCLTCSTCSKQFHYYCQGYNETTFNKMSKNSKSRLVCSDCKINSESGITTNKHNVTLQGLADSVNFMGNKFDEFNNTVSKLLNEMKELRKENRKISDINRNLVTEVNILKQKIDDIEQKSLEKMVEISGIPISKDEDCAKIAEEIAAKLNVAIHVKKAVRIPIKNNQFSKILVWLSHKDMKSNLVTKCKRNRDLFAKQINSNWSSTVRIFINEHITKVRRHLLFKTKEAAKEKLYKYVWINEGDILVRKDDQSKVFRIRELGDIAMKIQ